MIVCGGVRGGVCYYLGGSDRYIIFYIRIIVFRIFFLAFAVVVFFVGFAFDFLLFYDRLGVVGRGRSYVLSGG